MQLLSGRVLSAVAIVAIIAIVPLAWIAHESHAHSNVFPIDDRLEYYKLYVDLAKGVLVGFGATLLGILIPLVFSETRHEFERLRESRVAYSEVKTGIDYLPLRLSVLDLERAASLLQQVHKSKHEAELFSELGFHLKRKIKKTSGQWADNLFAKLFMMRVALEENAKEWNSLDSSQRLALIRAHIPAPHLGPVEEGAIQDKEIIGLERWR